MKKVLSLTVALFVCMGLTGLAEPLDMIKLSMTAVTNATAATTNTSPVQVDGSLEMIILDFTGGTMTTVDVDIVTSPDCGLGPARTLFTKDDITNDSPFYIRAEPDSITGTNLVNRGTVKIPLLRDKLQLKAYAAWTTGIVVNAYVIFSR